MDTEQYPKITPIVLDISSTDKVRLLRSEYRLGGGIAIRAVDVDDGSPYGMLTVCLPEHLHLLEPNEFFAKNWSENVSLARAALRSGYFVDTGRRVRTGFVTPEIWRLVDGVVMEER